MKKFAKQDVVMKANLLRFISTTNTKKTKQNKTKQLGIKQVKQEKVRRQPNRETLTNNLEDVCFLHKTAQR